MRRSAVIFFVTLAFLLALCLRSVSTLLALLIEDGGVDAIQRSDLPSPNSSLIETRPQLIPKIIHQTYKNDSIPEMWKNARQSCIDLHPDYEHMLWTDEKSMDFIAKEYPWFLETFQNYHYSIQRADAIRYFVLAHFGGTYIDLDDGCNRRLDPLLSYPAWVRRTTPTGVSNDVMGAVPQHPFFLGVIDLLQSYNKNWLLPYVTVMYSTGPLFLSVMWERYLNGEIREGDRVRVLRKDEYNRHSWSFFTHHQGSSWHGKDARLIFWMGEHWLLLTILGFSIGGMIALIVWRVYTRAVNCIGSRHKYLPLASPRGAVLPDHHSRSTYRTSYRPRRRRSSAPPVPHLLHPVRSPSPWMVISRSPSRLKNFGVSLFSRTPSPQREGSDASDLEANLNLEANLRLVRDAQARSPLPKYDEIEMLKSKS